MRLCSWSMPWISLHRRNWSRHELRTSTPSDLTTTASRQVWITVADSRPTSNPTRRSAGSPSAKSYIRNDRTTYTTTEMIRTAMRTDGLRKVVTPIRRS
jgi:hypothetical protein